MAKHNLSSDDIDFVNSLLIEAGNMAVDGQAFRLEVNRIGNTQSNLTKTPTIDEKISLFLVNKLKRRFANQMIVSEEALPQEFSLTDDYAWLIDPIDGTHHYLANDNQYSIMIGLLLAGEPIYGWVYNPASSTLYHGGPGQGAWCLGQSRGKAQLIDPLGALNSKSVRVIIGRRDKKNNPWLESLPNIIILQAGSIGYKLTRILEDEADILLHLAGRLKIWDTAGPVALALANGLEVGSKDIDTLLYPKDSFTHQVAMVIGKKGSLEWFRKQLIPAWIQ